MAWDEGLAQRLRAAYADRPGVAEKRMFGGLAFMVTGYMFCGVVGDTLMVRVGPDNYHEALGRPHARAMDFTGKPLTGPVYVAPEGIEEDADLVRWVEQCLAFVATLPAR